MNTEIPERLLDARPFFAGERQDAHGAVRPNINPSTGTAFVEVPDADSTDVDRAVTAARQAHLDGRWHTLPVLERQHILGAIGQGIRSRTMELSRLVARESGMPMHAARFIEIPMAADVFDFFAAAGSVSRGATLPFSLPGATTRYLVYTEHRPVGVAALITPWNFPLLMPAWKVAAALAAGAVAVLKPAPETPLTALALADIAREAGLPPGVLTILPGGDETGAALVRHPGVNKVALTGEAETGRKVATAAAQGLKRVSLELGGKSPNIVFADADLDEAVSGALFGIFFNSGQVCQAGSRILVQRPVYEEFCQRLVERASDLIVGSAEDSMTDLGPVISEGQFHRVRGHVERAIQEKGARLLLGGIPTYGGTGYFVSPTVFADVAPHSALAQSEVFGPVAAVMPFEDEAEAIGLANSTLYGLAAAVWTRDVKRALRMAHAIDSGTVWINAYQILTPTAPFGGFKESGYGRELGLEGLSGYQETKTVIVDLNDQSLQFF